MTTCTGSDCAKAAEFIASAAITSALLPKNDLAISNYSLPP
jgi:hypothetical protein